MTITTATRRFASRNGRGGRPLPLTVARKAVMMGIPAERQQPRVTNGLTAAAAQLERGGHKACDGMDDRRWTGRLAQMQLISRSQRALAILSTGICRQGNR